MWHKTAIPNLRSISSPWTYNKQCEMIYDFYWYLWWPEWKIKTSVLHLNMTFPNRPMHILLKKSLKNYPLNLKANTLTKVNKFTKLFCFCYSFIKVYVKGGQKTVSTKSNRKVLSFPVHHNHQPPASNCRSFVHCIVHCIVFDDKRLKSNLMFSQVSVSSWVW